MIIIDKAVLYRVLGGASPQSWELTTNNASFGDLKKCRRKLNTHHQTEMMKVLIALIGKCETKLEAEKLEAKV